jgi:hypothetical protein
VLRRTSGAGRSTPDGVRQDASRSGGGAAWLALALVGVIVTFAFGLWLVQSAHPLASAPAYDTGTAPSEHLRP